MIEKLSALLSALPKELYVFIISMLPIVELRGAIPVGAALNIPFYLNYLIAVVGNLLPVPFILLFIPKILDFMARFKAFRPIVEWLRTRAKKNSKKIIGEGENIEESGEIAMSKAIFIGLMLFVALPIPGTGAWTGSLVAALFDLQKKQSFLAVALGVLICGVIMCLASYGVVGFLKFLL